MVCARNQNAEYVLCDDRDDGGVVAVFWFLSIWPPNTRMEQRLVLAIATSVHVMLICVPGHGLAEILPVDYFSFMGIGCR